MQWLREWLASAEADVGDDELVLFLDAYDVQLLPSAADFAARFDELASATGARLIFGGERNCAPDPGLSVIYPWPTGAAADDPDAFARLDPGAPRPEAGADRAGAARTGFRYLNSGAYYTYYIRARAGRARAISPRRRS